MLRLLVKLQETRKTKQIIKRKEKKNPERRSSG